MIPRLFPVSPAKRPLIKGWPTEATADPIQILEWKRRFRGCWWGMTLDGLVCLDFDADRGGRVGGLAQPSTLLAFVQEFGAGCLPLLANWRRTRSGGVHVIMKAPAGLEQWNGVGWRPGVDVKAGRGCFIVVVGDGYGFLGGRDTFDPAELPEPPEDVAAALQVRKPACAKPPTLPPEWAVVARSTRNYRPLPRTAGYLLEDCRLLVSAGQGEQERELNRLGFKWGRRVARRYVSAERVLRSLGNAAMSMPNFRPAEPWERGQVEAKLQVSILAGYADGSS